MTRTLLLGALGLVLAVATGLGVHLLTRDTIALPVVRLEQDAGLAPASATSVARTTVRITTTALPATQRSTGRATPAQPTTTDDDTESESETEDNSGPGSDDSGRGRGRGGDDD